MMTCVVGIITDESIIMGADSANLDGFDAYTTMKNQQKIFKTSNNMLIGVAGSARIGQILNHDFDYPEDKREDPYKYIIKDLIPAIKTRLIDESMIENASMNPATNLLIGYKGRLFRMGSHFGVTESQDDYDAIGVGRYDSRGALYALKTIIKDMTVNSVEIAIKASINADVNIKPPIVFEYL